jgi:hypothetical protein
MPGSEGRNMVGCRLYAHIVTSKPEFWQDPTVTGTEITGRYAAGRTSSATGRFGGMALSATCGKPASSDNYLDEDLEPPRKPMLFLLDSGALHFPRCLVQSSPCSCSLFSFVTAMLCVYISANLISF